jgi:hypothetical protein
LVFKKNKFYKEVPLRTLLLLHRIFSKFEGKKIFFKWKSKQWM